MKKVIIILLIFLSTVSTADAKIGKFLIRAFYYESAHHPTLLPTDYDYKIEAAPGDSISMGVSTAYDTTLSDHEALSDLLTAIVVIGALLGLWFLFLSVMPTRKTPKWLIDDSHCVYKHDVTFPRNHERRFVYLADHSGVMLI